MIFNVIIPMAGEGSRFGFKFKPFLKLDDKTFIEHVLDTFLCYDDMIECYYFIVTRVQQEENDVTNRLCQLLPQIQLKIKVVCLDAKTDGPYQTIINAIGNNIQNVFICDCDHKVAIQPMISHLLQSTTLPDVLVPIWKISESEHSNWGKVVMNDSQILNYYEKENVKCQEGEQVYGIIGCHFLKSTSLFDFKTPYVNMSDFLKNNLGLYHQTCKINEAFFFGTPQMVEKYIDTRRSYENIICDIDGVLIRHNPHSNVLSDDNILINGCAEKLLEWKSQNKRIILMTSRSKTTRDGLEKLLKEKNIYFD